MIVWGPDFGSFRPRKALGAASLLIGIGAASAALAQQADPLGGMGQAEWRQSYETAPSLAVQRSTTPILSPQTVAATESAIQQYQAIAARGGWGTVPQDRVLKLGSKGQAVLALRQRLIATGDIEQIAGSSSIFDSFVQAGVKRFQTRHGLFATGVASAQTLAEMNVPVESRLRQLELNLVRLRSFSGDLGDRFVTLNIPAAALETVENGTVMTHHIAGVGKIDRQSPLLNVKATEINFNPFWTVPASIIRKDLIPKMQANPHYLTDFHIRVYNKDGEEVSPSSINWNSLDATNYKFREDQGEENSLGVVRINIPNQYGVYMHDTPEKGIFGDEERFVSSGCVRVQDVRDYVAWLLKDTPGWGRDQIDATINSGQRVDVKIVPPVNVYWVYITAWATPDGVVQFRPDIYQRDTGDTAAMAAVTSPANAPRPTEE
jgi:murein L,D-transpeptidase YcbB/YkuD